MVEDTESDNGLGPRTGSPVNVLTVAQVIITRIFKWIIHTSHCFIPLLSVLKGSCAWMFCLYRCVCTMLPSTFRSQKRTPDPLELGKVDPGN